VKLMPIFHIQFMVDRTRNGNDLEETFSVVSISQSSID
jgi:hypothetical protein